MVPTHATKNRVRYRYYVSQASSSGLAKSPAGSVSRVPASEIEAAVIKALAVHLGDRTKPTADQNRMHREHRHGKRRSHRGPQEPVGCSAQVAERRRSHGPRSRRRASIQGSSNDENGSLLLIPWCKPPSKKFREILLPPSVSRHRVRPIKAERRAALIKSIARGRDWLDEIVSGASQGVEQIAARHKCSVRHVNMTISMAFIAPALVKAAVEGRLPRGIGVASFARCAGRMVAPVRTAGACSANLTDPPLASAPPLRDRAARTNG